MVDKERYRVLVVDDHQVIRDSVRGLLSAEFDITTAGSAGEAEILLNHSRFDCLVSDVVMPGESGIDLARRWRDRNPELAVILMTITPDIYYGVPDINHIADVLLEKTRSVVQLGPAIKKVVWFRRMRHDIRLKHLSFIYDFRDTAREIEFRKMASDVGEAIRLEGVLARDQEPIAWVTYQDLLVAEERVVIGLASTVGCVGRCKICNSGLRTLRRVLSVKEMLAQFLIAVLRSPHTKGLFERPMDLTVNWTCEGEPGSNLDNVHEAMRILSNLRMMDMKFVITTMGNQSFLKKFLRKYTHLPNLFYWSLNFRPEVRRLLMPYTADHSAVAIRDTFREICQKQGTTLTVAWPVGHGINDGDKDVLFLKEIAGEPWQEVKLTLLNPDTVRLPFGLKHLKEQMFSTTQAHMDRFADKLEAAGIAYRKRRLVGLGFPAGTCGSTIPTAPQKGISKTPSPLGT